MIISKSAVFMRFSDCEPFHVSMMLGAGSGAAECSMVSIRELRPGTTDNGRQPSVAQFGRGG